MIYSLKSTTNCNQKNHRNHGYKCALSASWCMCHVSMEVSSLELSWCMCHVSMEESSLGLSLCMYHVSMEVCSRRCLGVCAMFLLGLPSRGCLGVCVPCFYESALTGAVLVYVCHVSTEVHSLELRGQWLTFITDTKTPGKLDKHFKRNLRTCPTVVSRYLVH